MDYEKIRQESEELYSRIDECIDTLIKARLNKDTNSEGKSLFQMEGLMVGTLQFLCWILDTLESEKPMDQEGFSKEFDEYFLPKNSEQKGRWGFADIFSLARHFAQWGAEQYKQNQLKQ